MRRALLIALAAAGCTPWAPRLEARDAQVGHDAQVDAQVRLDAHVPDASDGSVAPDASDATVAPDASTACPPLATRTVETITADVTADTIWTCDRLYRLDDEIHVIGATLTIEPGTVVQARDETTLVVEPSARIVAAGRADAPIVFTSDDAVGARGVGDWLGLALTGAAGAPRTLSDGLTRSVAYGGGSDEHDCGVLRYVRVEFAGDEVDIGSETSTLGALVLAGCGRGTEVDFVQLHRSEWEGLRVRSGTVELRHIVLTEIGDEALEWSGGWSGSAQYVLTQQDRDGAVGLQADGDEGSPIVANATFVGGVGTPDASIGFVAEDLATAVVTHAIFFAWTDAVIDVDGDTAPYATSGLLSLERSFTTAAPIDPEDTNDGGFDEAAFLLDPTRGNRLDADPMLEDPLVQPPDLRPRAGSPVGEVGCPPSDPRLDADACYAGGIAPGAVDWSFGWTTNAAD